MIKMAMYLGALDIDRPLSFQRYVGRKKLPLDESKFRTIEGVLTMITHTRKYTNIRLGQHDYRLAHDAYVTVNG